MTLLYFSTVVRGAPVENAGEAVMLDWDRKRIEKTVPIVPEDPWLDDPNPRGNARGGRGILFVDDMIIVASYHTLNIYDRDLNLLDKFSHPLMVGLHELCAGQDGSVWAASTAIDAALAFDLKTRTLRRAYWPREHPRFQQQWSLEPLKIDKMVDNRSLFLSNDFVKHPSHLHLNAVTVWKGEAYALFNRFGAVVNLDTAQVLIEDEALRGAHNLVIMPDGRCIVNNTRRHTVRIYDLAEGKHLKKFDLVPMHKAGRYTQRPSGWRRIPALLKRRMERQDWRLAQPMFVRGLDQVGSHLFVGISPASILQIDLNTGHLIDSFSYTDDLKVAVHGLRVWGAAE